mmetsp:Transcript_8537/g.25899  ORF Transcript_8537/g.25899 Transcript_8537/m.25899 type:complete len:330 (-) Transcript_8537:548-1537(-)
MLCIRHKPPGTNLYASSWVASPNTKACSQTLEFKYELLIPQVSGWFKEARHVVRRQRIRRMRGDLRPRLPGHNLKTRGGQCNRGLNSGRAHGSLNLCARAGNQSPGRRHCLRPRVGSLKTGRWHRGLRPLVDSLKAGRRNCRLSLQTRRGWHRHGDGRPGARRAANSRRGAALLPLHRAEDSLVVGQVWPHAFGDHRVDPLLRPRCVAVPQQGVDNRCYPLLADVHAFAKHHLHPHRGPFRGTALDPRLNHCVVGLLCRRQATLLHLVQPSLHLRWMPGSRTCADHGVVDDTVRLDAGLLHPQEKRLGFLEVPHLRVGCDHSVERHRTW